MHMRDESHPAFCLFPETDIIFVFIFSGSRGAPPFWVGSLGVRIGVVLGYLLFNKARDH